MSTPPSSSACPHCARPVPADAPLGACPHCLLAAGLPTALDPSAASETPPAAAPTPAELAPEFPGLDLLELLGRGGMGAVYKARQRDLDRLVALKILRPGLDADPGFAERFTREARALAQLNHPGIVTLYEFGRTSAGRYFILMEFVDGMNLRQLLAAGRLSPREALAIVPPLCDALQYAHDRGLVHRDIKPENLLIDRLGRIKIADFGIAKIATTTDTPTHPSDTIGHWSLNIRHSAEGGHSAFGGGTPGYMAPEQRDRPGEVDHRADLYALGVVLYQMLTGELPAAGQLRPPSTRVQLDVRLDEIVLRALEKDPARRYAAVSDFKTEIETVANTPPPPVSPPTPASRPPAPSLSAHAATSTVAAAPAQMDYGFSYRSRRTVFGWPLLHVAVGVDPVTGRRRIARGIIAIGDIAQGVVALGGLAMGGFTFGGISLGVFSYGGLALALFAYGGLGIGLLSAFAGLALAPVAIGGLAVGWYAFGGTAWGAYVSSPAHHDPEAIAFFGSWAREFTQIAGVAAFPIMVLGFALMFSALAWSRKRAATSTTAFTTGPASAATPPSPAGRPLSPWLLVLLLGATHIATLAIAADHLPARVASHFNADGRADGWMPRASYLGFICMFPCALAGLLALVGWMLRRLPARLINLPRRDHWLAPERRADTDALFFRWMAGPACLLLALFAQIHLVTVLANKTTPAHLSAGLLMGPIIGFLVAFMVWIIGLVLRFAEPEATPAKLRRQSGALLAVALLALVLPALPLLPHAASLLVHLSAKTDPRAWNLDVIVTDQSTWPPKTLPPDRALPVAGDTLALLGSCELREPATAADWRAAESAPHLRLDYPRASEGKMPDVILVPLPLSADNPLWTRKGDRVIRHATSSADKRDALWRTLGVTASPSTSPRFRFGETRYLALPRSRPMAYNFDHDLYVPYSPTARSPHGIEASDDWHAEHGTDVFADPDSHQPGLLFLGTDLTEAPPEIWDAPADAAAGRGGTPGRGRMTFIPAPAHGRLPTTLLYRTPQGTLVLVQLTGATDAGEIMLRFKPIVPAAPEPLVIDLTNYGATGDAGQTLDLDQLRATLRQHALSQPQTPVKLLAGDLTKVATINAALEVCAAAGITNIEVHRPDPPRAPGSNSP
ncbi:MAG: protein kinase [Burkholderiales bacterium]|nr:protein kinase [Opitutaceae bacterium]